MINPKVDGYYLIDRDINNLTENVYIMTKVYILLKIL
jgi:hypothetical protein